MSFLFDILGQAIGEAVIGRRFFWLCLVVVEAIAGAAYWSGAGAWVFLAALGVAAVVAFGEFIWHALNQSYHEQLRRFESKRKNRRP